MSDKLKERGGKALVSFLSYQYDLPEAHARCIANQANALYQTPKDTQTNRSIATAVINAVGTKFDHETACKFELRTLTGHPSCIATLLIAHHDLHPDHSMEELLERRR
jgi:hypothetical protein